MGIGGQQEVGEKGREDDPPGSLLAEGFVDQIDQRKGDRIDEDGRRDNDATQLDGLGSGDIGDQLTGDVESDEDGSHGDVIFPLHG